MSQEDQLDDFPSDQVDLTLLQTAHRKLIQARESKVVKASTEADKRLEKARTVDTGTLRRGRFVAAPGQARQ
uniref:Uncharacterized protein n=1 Tax=Trichuris muris TaxID=70415 RepID=A0A5S6PZD7_TRIMR